MNKKQIHFHGEVCIVEVDEIPGEAKELASKGGDLKLADSEVTGNDHMLEINPGVSVFQWNEDFYVKSREETKVYCLLKDRHHDLKLPSGNYKITPAKEFDHLKQEKRRVLD